MHNLLEATFTDVDVAILDNYQDETAIKESVGWWIKYIPNSIHMQIKRDLFDDWDTVIKGVTRAVENIGDGDESILKQIRRDTSSAKNMIDKRIENAEKRGKDTSSMKRYRTWLLNTLPGLLSKKEAELKKKK